MNKSSLALILIFVFTSLFATNNLNISSPERTGRSVPIAITASSAFVDMDSAILRGRICSNAEDVVVWFEYGTTTSYGTVVAAEPHNVYTYPDIYEEVSAEITGLAPFNQYYYRVYVEWTGETVYGSSSSFLTVPNFTPYAQTNAATDVYIHNATLNGLVNPMNSLVDIVFEYGTDATYGTTVAAEPASLDGTTPTVVTKALTGLTPNTTYHYHVVADNGSMAGYGLDMTFTTPATECFGIFPEDGAMDLPRQTTVTWEFNGLEDIVEWKVYWTEDGVQTYTRVFSYGGTVKHFQLPEANWGETVSWYVIPVDWEANDCEPSITRTFTVMSEPADPSSVPTQIVYAEQDISGDADPDAISLPAIDLGNGDVQPTIDCLFDSAPFPFTFWCEVSDQPQSPVPNPSDVIVAFRVNLPSDVSTDFTFNWGGGEIPASIYQREDGSGVWTEYIPSGEFVAGSVNILASAGGRAYAREYVVLSSETLPVELSSFTAMQTQSNLARIEWATASESELLGYHVLRGTQADVDSAMRITAEPVPAQNSPSGNSYEVIDNDVRVGETYNYWLESVDLSGSLRLHGPVTLTIVSGGEEQDVPDAELLTGIRSIYPNPFNPSTTISYYLTEGASVELSIFNIRGEKVRSFKKGYQNGDSHYQIVWDGCDDNGKKTSTGTYLFCLTAGGREFSQKAIMIK